MSFNVSIRADASSSIGYGHVMRCLTLAQELKRKGATVEFISRSDEGNLNNFLRQNQFPVIELTSLVFDKEVDAHETASVISNCQLLIVDHYIIDVHWEQVLVKYVDHIMVIDDLANRNHNCDFLLDQNFYLDHDRYRGLVPSDCIQFLGPEYALLRQEFLKLRTNEINIPIRKVVMFFGGADSKNVTEKALKALLMLGLNIEINVIMGKANPNLRKVLAEFAEYENIHFHIQIDYIAELMRTSDLAIGAGGATNWERFCMGLPSLVITTADNQLETTIDLEKSGLIYYLGHYNSISMKDIVSSFSEIIDNNEELIEMSSKVRKLVDGRGVEKTVNELLNFLL